MSSNISWTNDLGSKLIQEVKIEISPFINITQKICSKCNQKFTYERKDDEEIFFRQFSSLKKGNLDLCFNCDELDEKLSGCKSFGKIKKWLEKDQKYFVAVVETSYTFHDVL